MENPLMDSQPMSEAMKIQEIFFPNGNRALAVIAPIGTRATDLVRVIGIPQPGSLIILAGGAAGMDVGAASNIGRLLTDGIAHIAATHVALIIDGGTQSGVMELMGRGVAKQQQRPALGH